MVVGNSVCVLDNGAYTAKVGYANDEKPKIVPNCIMKAKSERHRAFIGDQIEECRNASGLYYMLPFQKGYVVNWDIQKNVWDYIFSKDCVPVDFQDSPVIATEPFFNFPSVQEAMTEIFFEEYECRHLLRINAGDLSCYNYQQETGAICCLLVDCGYSFTHVVPYIRGKKLKQGIRRIPVGGKLLTNHLKDIISYRQLNVMDETFVMNQAKEDACFVSLDFMGDMNIARKRGEENTILRDYVLPDYTTVRRGYLLDPSVKLEEKTQCLRLNNERFAVPEILFHPSDIGINRVGIPEAIQDSISVCPPETHPHLYNNILLVGGCTLFPGFRERVEKEVRSIAPEGFKVNVTLPSDPITYAWGGGKKLSKSKDFPSMLVSREEYKEKGHPFCFEKFDI